MGGWVEVGGLVGEGGVLTARIQIRVTLYPLDCPPHSVKCVSGVPLSPELWYGLDHRASARSGVGRRLYDHAQQYLVEWVSLFLRRPVPECPRSSSGGRLSCSERVTGPGRGDREPRYRPAGPPPCDPHLRRPCRASIPSGPAQKADGGWPGGTSGHELDTSPATPLIRGS